MMLIKKVLAIFISISVLAATGFFTGAADTVLADMNYSAWYADDTPISEESTGNESLSVRLDDDFENYSLGVLTSNENWTVLSKNSTGGSIDIIDDRNSSKMCKISCCYVEGTYHDAYLRSKSFNIEGKTIVSFDYSCDDFLYGGFAANFRGAESLSYNYFSVDKYGIAKFKDVDSAKAIQFEKGKNYNVTFVADTELGIASVYINHKLEAENNNYSSLLSDTLNNATLRLYVSANANAVNGKSNDVYVDNVNLFMVDGEKKGILKNDFALYVHDDDINEDTLIDKVHAGHIYAKSSFFNNEEETKGFKVIQAVYNKQDALIKVLHEDVTVAAKSAVTRKFDFGNIGFDETGKISVFTFDNFTNITPIGKDLVCKAEDGRFNSMLLKNDVKDMFESNGKNVHPRIMATADTFEDIKNNPNLENWRNDVIEAADNFLTRPLSSMEYILVGGRLLNVSRWVKSSMEYLGMAYRLTGDTKYSDKAYEILEQESKFADWHPSHILDTSEMTAGFAIGYDWMYDVWEQNPAKKKIIEDAIVNLGLSVAKSGYEKNDYWTKESVNRNVVNNGSFVMGALAVADDYPDLAYDIIRKGIYNINAYMMPSFAPDGAWEEGVGYIQYTLEYLAKTFSTLEASLGTRAGLENVRGLNRTNYFILFAQSQCGQNNFHDDSLTGELLFGEMLYLAKVFDDDKAVSLYVKSKSEAGLGGSVEDLLWYRDYDKSSDSSLPLNAYFRDTEFVSMRDSWNKLENKAYISFHGGKNSGGHSHIDAGTFVLDLQGVRWAHDLGTDQLTYLNSNVNKTDVYRIRAEGHNTLVINPPDETNGSTENGGQDFDANCKVTDIDGDSTYSSATLDLSSAYKKYTSKVLRTYELTDNKQIAVINDEITLKNDNSDVYWFMHTKASAKKTDDGIVLNQNGKTVLVSYETDADISEISVVPATPLSTSPIVEGVADNSDYQKVMIKLKGSGKVNLKVTIKPLKDEVKVNNPYEEINSELLWTEGFNSTTENYMNTDENFDAVQGYSIYTDYGTGGKDNNDAVLTVSAKKGYDYTGRLSTSLSKTVNNVLENGKYIHISFEFMKKDTLSTQKLIAQFRWTDSNGNVTSTDNTIVSFENTTRGKLFGGAYTTSYYALPGINRWVKYDILLHKDAEGAVIYEAYVNGEKKESLKVSSELKFLGLGKISILSLLSSSESANMYGSEYSFDNFGIRTTDNEPDISTCYYSSPIVSDFSGITDNMHCVYSNKSETGISCGNYADLTDDIAQDGGDVRYFKIRKGIYGKSMDDSVINLYNNESYLSNYHHYIKIDANDGMGYLKENLNVHLCYEMAFDKENTTSTSISSSIKFSNGSVIGFTPISVSKRGIVTFFGRKTGITVKSEKWYRYDILLNSSTGLASLYVDGKLIVKDYAAIAVPINSYILSLSNETNHISFRFQYYAQLIGNDTKTIGTDIYKPYGKNSVYYDNIALSYIYQNQSSDMNCTLINDKLGENIGLGEITLVDKNYTVESFLTDTSVTNGASISIVDSNGDNVIAGKLFGNRVKITPKNGADIYYDIK